MGDRTRDTNRLEGMLEDASIKLSAVASILSTVSAQAMLGALIAGGRDPRVLAGLAKGRMRTKIPQLTVALIGHVDAGHAQMVGSLGSATRVVRRNRRPSAVVVDELHRVYVEPQVLEPADALGDAELLLVARHHLLDGRLWAWPCRLRLPI